MSAAPAGAPIDPAAPVWKGAAEEAAEAVLEPVAKAEVDVGTVVVAVFATEAAEAAEAEAEAKRLGQVRIDIRSALSGRISLTVQQQRSTV
jgi:hypothetical protein